MQTKCLTLWAAVSRRRRLCTALHALSHAVVIAAAAVLLAFGWLAAWEAPFGAAASLLALALGFVGVSAWRHFWPSPRPYECFPEVFASVPKETCARSFPSRHAFCAFSIGTAACATLPVLGAILLTLAAVQAVARVLLGIHFIRDVAVGALLGVAVGLVSFGAYVLLSGLSLG